MPTISISSTGRVDVAWGDYRNGSLATEVGDFFYTYSLDGVNWPSTDVRLSPQSGAKTCVHNDMVGIVSSGDNAFVAYSHNRSETRWWKQGFVNKVTVIPAVYPSSYTATVGIVVSFGNAQSASDGGAEAILGEMYTTIYDLNVQMEFTGVPSGATHTLEVRYRVMPSADIFGLQVWDGTVWTTKLLLA